MNAIVNDDEHVEDDYEAIELSNGKVKMSPAEIRNRSVTESSWKKYSLIWLRLHEWLRQRHPTLHHWRQRFAESIGNFQFYSYSRTLGDI